MARGGESCPVTYLSIFNECHMLKSKYNYMQRGEKMDFYEGCSDGTFEIVEDLHFGCIICGEEYIIDKNTLYISVMSQYPPEQGIMNEHYFHGECRCRKCNERLFYRIKAYERPVGRLHHIIDECDDIDWLEKPIVRETGEISRPLHYSRKSQLILEDSRITLPYAGIALNDGNGTIANWEEICEISGRNKPTRIVIPTYGNKLVDILLTETGSISYRDNKLVQLDLNKLTI